jgi:hypothetical protein
MNLGDIAKMLQARQGAQPQGSSPLGGVPSGGPLGGGPQGLEGVGGGVPVEQPTGLEQVPQVFGQEDKQSEEQARLLAKCGPMPSGASAYQLLPQAQKDKVMAWRECISGL